jgi:hypothetical protein
VTNLISTVDLDSDAVNPDVLKATLTYLIEQVEKVSENTAIAVDWGTLDFAVATDALNPSLSRARLIVKRLA